MVRALHEAGIEVILDVVYNHTAEGNHLGPDDRDSAASTTPRTTASRRRTAGTTRTTPAPGNSLNVRNPHALQLIMDTLRYWVTRDARRRLPLRPRGDARPRVLRRRPAVELLRARAAGPGGLAGEAHRRAVGRRARRLPGGQLPARSGRSGTASTATRCATSGAASRRASASSRRASPGSADLYENNGRRPVASINFVTAHDGFTLRDLVSYNEKHNEANGEGGNDGESHNRSWNSGVEGDDRRPRRAPCCGPASSATSSRRCCCRRACRCCCTATSSAARSRATTTRTRRTTSSAGCTGTPPTSRSSSSPRRSRSCARTTRRSGAAGSSTAARSRARRARRARCPTSSGCAPTARRCGPRTGMRRSGAPSACS